MTEETVVSDSGSTTTVVQVVDDTVTVLDISAQGPAGPAGPTGPTGPVGPPGPAGIEVDAVPPSDTSILWADTSEPGDAVVPVGGTAGESLVKLSGSDYDTGWEDRARIVNTDGDAGLTIYVGSVDPDGTYTLAAGDVWIEVP